MVEISLVNYRRFELRLLRRPTTIHHVLCNAHRFRALFPQKAKRRGYLYLFLEGSEGGELYRPT